MLKFLANPLTAVEPAVRTYCDYKHRNVVKLKVLRALVFVSVSCLLGGFLGLQPWIWKKNYVSMVGFLLAMSVYKSIGRIPEEDKVKVGALLFAVLFQWAWLVGALVPVPNDVELPPEELALPPMPPPVKAGVLTFNLLFQDGFILCALAGALLHSVCIWSANEWKWLPWKMESSHLCMLVTLIWAVASSCFFGGDSMYWLTLLLIVNISSMVYALAYEYELDSAAGIGSIGYSDLAYGFLVFGPQKAWKAIVKLLFKKIVLQLWKRTVRRGIDWIRGRGDHE